MPEKTIHPDLPPDVQAALSRDLGRSANPHPGATHTPPLIGHTEAIPTVKVTSKDTAFGYVIINAADYDPAVHTLLHLPPGARR